MALVKLNNRGVRSVSTFGSISSLGTYTFIKKITASSSSTISFVDGSSDVVLDNTYKEYLFTFNNIHPSADSNQFLINFSADTGSNYNVTKTSTVWRAFLSEGDSSGSGYVSSNDLAQGTGVQILASSLGADADHTTQGYLHLFDPSSTTYVKHFISRISTTSSDDQIMDFHVAGYCNTTSAVDAAQFSMTTGNIDAGDICLYGIN